MNEDTIAFPCMLYQTVRHLNFNKSQLCFQCPDPDMTTTQCQDCHKIMGFFMGKFVLKENNQYQILVCPECDQLGLSSHIRSDEPRVTAIGYQVMYDLAGKFHDHDPNVIEIDYSCSEGHEWTEVYRSHCWCGWPNNEDQDDEDLEDESEDPYEELDEEELEYEDDEDLEEEDDEDLEDEDQDPEVPLQRGGNLK